MKETFKLILETIGEFLLDNIITILNILFVFLIYKLISYLYKKLDIRQYKYINDSDDLGNPIYIHWFSENDKKDFKNNEVANENIYRFKDEKSQLVILINKNDISFIDKIKLIGFFYSKKNQEKKMLPEFLIKKYIVPQLTVIQYNFNKMLINQTNKQ